MFSEKDTLYMELAIKEALKAAKKGNYPCGAVLVINDTLIDQAYNQKESRNNRISHPEMLLYFKYSQLLKQSKVEEANITIYTTLEPCLMCFGTATIHRVSRIVVSSPDPLGDMSQIDGQKLGVFYKQKLPKLEYGLLFDKTFAFTKKYLEEKNDIEAHFLIQQLQELKKKFIKVN